MVAAVPLAAGLWWVGGPKAAVAGAAASLMVDLDHVVDYLWQRPGPLTPAAFFHYYHTNQVPYLLLVTHSWELLALAWLGWWWLGGAVWLGALLAGWSWHLVCDQAGNRVGIWLYFLVYRAWRRFRRDRLPCPQPVSLDTLGRAY
jgi:hypothetical protein